METKELLIRTSAQEKKLISKALERARQKGRADDRKVIQTPHNSRGVGQDGL
jgi:hypothetical protein